MRKSISLADEARRRFCDENQDVVPTDIHIALSLGPFGATLSPTQEFDGFYPPPYGPKGYTATGDNLNSFSGEHESEVESEEALALFHLRRLRVFASDSLVWESIDCVCFETIPLAREVRAIRKAVSSLYSELAMIENQGQRMKPWWTSFVFPDGRCPERSGGCSISVLQVVQAALMTLGDGNNADEVLRPNALGINCTRMEFLNHILTELGRAVECLLEDKGRPWLVIYPNGGDAYDMATGKWRIVDGEALETKSRTWAQELVAIVRQEANGKIWDGIVVGGCCRAGPVEIHELSELLNRVTCAS
jgi:homocysteine S-methyltransferase